MQNIFEIFKIVFSVIATGLCTFLITKYTYNKNRPLDKLEIAYNRVYYPLYQILFSNDGDINNIEEVINKGRLYFNKYGKYIDVSTMRLFNLLCECEKEARRKSIYRRFKDNIHNRNSYLRRRLGYLEPGFVQMYKYAMPSQKSFFRIMVCLCLAYSFAILYSITIHISDVASLIFALLFVSFVVIVIFEGIVCFLRFLYYRIRK